MSAGGFGAAGGVALGAIGMGVDAHVRNQNWSRTKRILQESIRWRVNDLRQAGLNPVLAASSGFGGGASGYNQASNSAGLANAFVGGYGADTARKKMPQEIATAKAQEQQTKAQRGLTRELGRNAAINRERIRSDAEAAAHNAEAASVNVAKIRAEVAPMIAIAEALQNPKYRAQFQWNSLWKPSGLIEKGLSGGLTQGGGLTGDFSKWFNQNFPTQSTQPKKPGPPRPPTHSRGRSRDVPRY